MANTEKAGNVTHDQNENEKMKKIMRNDEEL